MTNKARETTTSVWMDTARTPGFEPLRRDAEADVCVVGAGIAGLSTAYQLAREGRRVILLDDGPIAGGQTQRTTAHLSCAIDDRFSELERVHGEEGSRLAAESHAAAIDRIEAIAREEAFDCDFKRVDGYLFLGPDQSEKILEDELAAAHRAGLTGVEFVPKAPLPFDTRRCLRFPRQGQFHPLRYTAGLVDAFTRRGGVVHTQTRVAKVAAGAVETEAGPVVKAGAVVVATNTPINDMVVIHTKQAPYLTYAVGFRIPRGAVEPGLYWDTLDPYHYIRMQQGDDADALIVGGEDHKSGQAEDQEERWGRLEAWTRERFPQVQAVEARWSGMVMETTDGLAFIGRNPREKGEVYIATGDSGMGMTHGVIAGMLLTDLILGRENPWSTIYDPSRKPVWGMAWKEFIRENANVAKEYARDWLGPGDVSSVDEIPAGHGAVIRRGLSKHAVYRDESGAVHERSAVCPHLGCIVHWNGAEKTWDCPCHGSRFDPEGQGVVGPANRPLGEV